jgi:hypothetical protein
VDDRQKVRGAICVLAARKGDGAQGVCTISDCKVVNLHELCTGTLVSIQQLAKKKNLIATTILFFHEAH